MPKNVIAIELNNPTTIAIVLTTGDRSYKSTPLINKKADDTMYTAEIDFLLI